MRRASSHHHNPFAALVTKETTEEAAVYEKSSGSNATSYHPKIDHKAIVAQLKADAEARQNQLTSIVEQMISKQGNAYGQASLFEDAGIKEFTDFKFEECEELPKMEMLNMEKELIGCFVSGHPLDDYRKIIETCATCNSETILHQGKQAFAELQSATSSGRNSWSMRNSGTSYIAIGMLQGLRVIMTKKGTQMAFAKLADFKDSI